MSLSGMGRTPFAKKKRPRDKSRFADSGRNKGLFSKSLARLAKFTGNRDWSIIRINIVIGIFCLVWVVLWFRAWQLQMIEGPHLADRAKRQHMTSELVSGKRGNILDRNGQALARSVEIKSVYANPHLVGDIEQTANILAPILGLSIDKIKEDLNKSNKRFIWLKRKIDDSTAKAVRQANLSGIGLSKEYDRFYPFKHMAGQLIGFVGMDDKGLEGIERSMDDTLGAMPVLQLVQRDAMGRRFYLNDRDRHQAVGEDITLTLDMRVQFIAEECIAKTVREFGANWGGAIVVDIPSGDILAWAQYPFFNPNNYKESSPKIYRNRLAQDSLEPGSTFKPLVMAIALQEKKVTPNTLINCEGGKWTYKNFTIRDTSNREIIPASKVMRYSSNIGMAKIGQSLGAKLFYKSLKDLGFGDSAFVPIANSRGILRQPKDWGEMDVMATSFGQSISVTALQMTQAYLTLLNGGVFKPLRIVMGQENVQEAPRRVLSKKSVDEVVDMMRDVVEQADGTGKRARINGIEVGGKTGTAQKADSRSKTYGEKRLASFVGFFPVNEPKYLILVFVDEPTRNQYGGVVAAPAFQEIGSSILTQSGELNETRVAEKDAKNSKRKRGFKLSQAPAQPWIRKAEHIESPNTRNLIAQKQKGMQFPGHLAKASEKIPDVRGKTVRNAVELFARAGVVPELKGDGERVIQQTPPAGTPWPEKKTEYILWLSQLQK